MFRDNIPREKKNCVKTQAQTTLLCLLEPVPLHRYVFAPFMESRIATLTKVGWLFQLNTSIEVQTSPCVNGTVKKTQRLKVTEQVGTREHTSQVSIEARVGRILGLTSYILLSLGYVCFLFPTLFFI